MKNFSKYQPISKKCPHILHGGDYNPDQWIEHPEIIEEDMRLMKLAGCNVMSLGIFSWAMLEPSEDNYDFSFLDMVMDKLAENGIYVFLATPSAGKPAWMSKAHPEILRVDAMGHRMRQGERANHCYTSVYYREKTYKINKLLAKRYKDHPALIGWHISNEYHGECFCPKCEQAFREWLKEKYGDIDTLNRMYWNTFWSHTYSDWDEIEPPTPLGEMSTHALNLDWKRFVSHQTLEFMKNEIAPIREITPDIPVTSNFMYYFNEFDYFKFKDYLDVISWDSYPKWHSPTPNHIVARDAALMHDLYRSMKAGKPFMLMESATSTICGAEFNKLKRPNMHTLSSLQAVAHGSDTVQYFQWRKGRGGAEKFHGAVIDHCGHENTRIFKDVANLGKILSKLDDVVGTYVKSDVALYYDYENNWAIDDLWGLHNRDRKYFETLQKHYNTFWEQGINVDIVNSDSDLSAYKLVVAPMLYMTKPELIDRLKKFVENGGTLVCTYVTGWVDEHDLCYTGGFPAMELKDVFGLWSEEIDTLYENDRNYVKMRNGKIYEAVDYCELIHLSTAETLGTYTEDFYAEMPAVAKNKFGKGYAYYLAFRSDMDFNRDFYSEIISQIKPNRALDIDMPEGVTAHAREDESNKYIFVENYKDVSCTLKVSGCTDMLTGEKVSDLKLEPFECRVIKQIKL